MADGKQDVEVQYPLAHGFTAPTVRYRGTVKVEVEDLGSTFDVRTDSVVETEVVDDRLAGGAKGQRAVRQVVTVVIERRSENGEV